MRYGKKAWIGLAVYLAIVEAFAPAGETLSETVDDWIEQHPGKAVWHLLVGLVGAHLLNLIPEKYDPIHIVFMRASLRKEVRTHRVRLFVEQKDTFR